MLRSYRNGVVLAAAVAFIAYAPVVGAQGSAKSQVASGSQESGSEEPLRSNAPSTERQTVGTVTSIGRGSIVVHADDGRFVVYELEPTFIRIPAVVPGSRVMVITASNDNDPAPMALSVEALPPRQGLAQRSQNPPPDVRRLESELERQARRFRIGLDAGVALDPEMISVNAFTTFTPFLQRGIMVRPNVELAFGEVTTLIGLHVEGLYMLPGLRRSIRWAPYVGAGQNFSFSHRSIDEDEFVDPDVAPLPLEDDRFDFSQWNWNNGFNFILGARNPNGTFFEMKATAWGVARVRMLGGFEF